MNTQIQAALIAAGCTGAIGTATAMFIYPHDVSVVVLVCVVAAVVVVG